MERYIVIPIYDHTDEREISEIMEELSRLGFANQPFVANKDTMLFAPIKRKD